MENLNRFLTILTDHWKIITLVGSFLVGGSYLIARYRTSGMRKVLSAHGKILDDLSSRLNSLRIELENARDELSAERFKLIQSEQRVRELEARVVDLENREKELLVQISLKHDR